MNACRALLRSLSVGFVLAPGLALSAVPLAAHRAVYEIKLDRASERSGIEGVNGRLVYDFDGSECDGYTVSFRFVTRIDLGGEVRVTDQQMTTFEDVRERMFQFANRSFTDARPDREVNGTASEEADGIRVELRGEEPTEVELPEAVFPTQHLVDLLEAAQRGETVYEARVFDGSEEGTKALDTTAVIAKPQTGRPAEMLPDEFDAMRYWPVTIAYYATGGDAGESLPVYRIEMKLYENGVTRDIAMDYGEFTLEGTLSQIEMREADACE